MSVDIVSKFKQEFWTSTEILFHMDYTTSLTSVED